MPGSRSRNWDGRSAFPRRLWRSGCTGWKRPASSPAITLSIDAAKLGAPIRVLVRLTIPGGDLQISRTVTAIKELSEIGRCHRITGANRL